MTLSVVTAMIMVLGASPSSRAKDLQVEAVAATGSELPELREAVARALVVGGARVVMRGPTAGSCEDCTKVKVTELSAGVFRVEVKELDDLASTTLDLSSGSRLLDRARAIAIHARLLIGKPSGSDRPAPEGAALPARKPEARNTSSRDKAKSQATPMLVAQEPSRERPAEPAPVVSPNPAAPKPVLASALSHTPAAPPVRVVRSETRPPTRPSEARSSTGKSAEGDRPGVARQDTSEAPRRTAAPPATINETATRGLPRPQWPWIPTAAGAAAAIGAGVCAVMARQKYNDLSDRDRSLESARSLKSSGESWQTAAIVLSGVAAAGLGVGIAGFATRSSGGTSVSAAVSPIPGGGMAMLAWELP